MRKSIGYRALLCALAAVPAAGCDPDVAEPPAGEPRVAGIVAEVLPTAGPATTLFTLQSDSENPCAPVVRLSPVTRRNDGQTWSAVWPGMRVRVWGPVEGEGATCPVVVAAEYLEVQLSQHD